MSSYLDEIEARINAAAEGPWETNSEEGATEFGDYTVHGVVGVAEATWASDGAPAFAYCEGMDANDAEFIAHARTDLPRLLAAVRAVEAEHQESNRQCLNYSHIYINPDPMCPECRTVCEACDRTYPCATIRALTEALEGEG